jgi:hypothetical protein
VMFIVMAGQKRVFALDVPAIHVCLHRKARTWMPGTRPRLSGSIFVDRVHGVDSSVF